MKVTTTTILQASMTLALGIAVGLYFAILYPAHVCYQEQFQLFVNTAGYAADIMSAPGGVADYLSRFCVQHFGHPVAGAAIIAALLCLYQWLVWLLMPRRPASLYPVSFVPAVLMWMMLCDENALLTALTAQLVAMGVAVCVDRVGNVAVRRALTLLSVPLLYMACGTLGYVGPAVMLVREFARPGRRLMPTALLALGCVAVAVTCPIVARQLFPYPSARLWAGLHYHRMLTVTATRAFVAAGVVCAICALSTTFGAGPRRPRTARIVAVVGVVTIAVMAYMGIRDNTDLRREDVMAYDQLLRQQRWNDIIREAEARTPDAPMTVQCLNLALGRTGQLGDRMFQFFQNGVEGLYTGHVRDFVSPLITAEVFYQMGMTAMAQMYMFEAQEAIPDRQRSGRILQRLAQTNLIAGNYEVARKYLTTLTHTTYYGDWARQTLGLLGDEAAINSHPEYGPLRRARADVDVMFAEVDAPSLQRLLATAAPDNTQAHEYAMAICLLNKDLDGFQSIYESGAFTPYRRIPTAFQEALALIWTHTNTSWEGMPWHIDEAVKRQAESLFADMRTTPNKQLLRNKYHGTYLAYFLL